MSDIQIGDLAKDTITGFTGIVVAKTQWLNGCDRLSLQPRELDKDGRVIMSESFDLVQLELVEKAAVKLPGSRTKKKVETGGPRPEPQRWSE